MSNTSCCLVYVDPTDARSEEQTLAYYRARGFVAADIPNIRAERAQQFRGAPDTEIGVAAELERTHFAAIRALPPAPDVPVGVSMAIRYDRHRGRRAVPAARLL